MDNVVEVVALLRQQAALEHRLMNTAGPGRGRMGRSPPPVAGS
jgi:hypothetical protein